MGATRGSEASSDALAKILEEIANGRVRQKIMAFLVFFGGRLCITLEQMIADAKLDRNAKFNAELQDKLFDALLRYKQGGHMIAYLEGDGSLDDAAHACAREWASIGVQKGRKRKDGTESNGKQSYYVDGINHASVSGEEIREILKKSRNQYNARRV